MSKPNKYDYLLVIQGFYGYGYGWEDLSAYPDTREGFKEARTDLKEYRMAAPAAYRIIHRREVNDGYAG